MGQNQLKNDLNRKLKDTGVYGPIEDIPRTEWDRLYGLFPALYFCLVYTGKHKADSTVLSQIALTSPNGVPNFPDYDLWLRRKALTISIQNKGISFLLDNIGPDLPLDLVYYACLKLP